MAKSGIRTTVAAVASVLCAVASPTLAAPPATAASAAPAPAQDDVIATARRVADWQLDHMETFDYVRTFQVQTRDPLNWIQATFYAGLADFADATGDSRYAQAIEQHGEAQGWSFQPRPRHADADAIAHAWIWSAMRHDGDARDRRLAPVRARFEPILAAPSDAPLIFMDGPGESPCQVRWCWSDAVFMAPPVWTALSQATGDARYREHARRELNATIEALYDRGEGLFYRDSRFFDRRGANGKKVFWSRGNGWAYAGLAKVLQSLPTDDPDRAGYEAIFRQMSERLLDLQGPQGYWPVSLLDPAGPPETSGTAFFVYGMAWGVNAGLLDATEYGQSVSRGWNALESAIQPDGRLGWVQQVGYAPDQVIAPDTQLYGVGAFLMAVSQVSRRQEW